MKDLMSVNLYNKAQEETKDQTKEKVVEIVIEKEKSAIKAANKHIME